MSVTFLFFRRFRNTDRHLIFFFFYNVYFDGPAISRCAGSPVMMPELD